MTNGTGPSNGALGGLAAATPIALGMIGLAVGNGPGGSVSPSAQTGTLTIHQINVQQGDCTLIVGPDGTTFLIDGGNAGKGTNEVVPYLQSIGIHPPDGIHFMLATHRDSDHLGGLDEVINAGYQVTTTVWDNGSSKGASSSPGSQIQQFLTAASGTPAGAVQPMPLDQVIDLGGGATATCVAVHGEVTGHGAVSGVGADDENDLSVAMLVRFGDFEYLTAGDLGGGDDDFSCTGRNTGQHNVETPLAISLRARFLTEDGIEVLDVNHHGSESSTNRDTMNLLTPSVAVINTGAGQRSNFKHPREDIVDEVLLAQATSCITAAPALVLQTEEGDHITTNDPNGNNVSVRRLPERGLPKRAGAPQAVRHAFRSHSTAPKWAGRPPELVRLDLRGPEDRQHADGQACCRDGHVRWESLLLAAATPR